MLFFQLTILLLWELLCNQLVNHLLGVEQMTKNFSAWPANFSKNLVYPEIPVFEFLNQSAQRCPNRIAIVFAGSEMTYLELKILSERFASGLHELGVKKGDRVAIGLPNCPQFAIAYYGIMRLGAIFTPLSPLLSAKEVTHQLKDSGASTLISLDLLFPGIKDIISLTDVKNIITTSLADTYNSIVAPIKPIGKIEVPETYDMAKILAEHEPFADEIVIDVKKDLAHLAYTGGTTGVSKGVMISHYNVVVNVLQFGNWACGSTVEWSSGQLKTVFLPELPASLRYDQDNETTMVIPPWFHAMGTVGFLNMQIFIGATMIVLPRFEVDDYLENLKKYKATLLGGAPQLFIPLLSHKEFSEYDLCSVKIITSGAAPLPDVLIHSMLSSFENAYINEAYGCTECTMGATSNPPGREHSKVGSVGLPVFDTEIKIINLTNGTELTQHEEGEICIKGPQVMMGYWKNQDATRAVLEDGWLHTGDIGKLDEDGFLFITDRLKDMIIYKGYNVYPRELEEVLYQFPDVEQAAVLGKKDDSAGEIPVAFVKRVENSQVNEEILLEFVNSKIAVYKKLRKIYFVDSIPVSGAGKILKRELRDQLES